MNSITDGYVWVGYGWKSLSEISNEMDIHSLCESLPESQLSDMIDAFMQQNTPDIPIPPDENEISIESQEEKEEIPLENVEIKQDISNLLQDIHQQSQLGSLKIKEIVDSVMLESVDPLKESIKHSEQVENVQEKQVDEQENSKSMDNNPSESDGFVDQVIESLFTPGIHGKVLQTMHISFIALVFTLLCLLILTKSIHVVFLLAITGCLWISTDWFLKMIQEEESKKLQ